MEIKPKEHEKLEIDLMLLASNINSAVKRFNKRNPNQIIEIFMDEDYDVQITIFEKDLEK